MKTSTQAISGAAQLAFDSVQGITNSVEQMHETIAVGATSWAPDTPGPAHGLIASGIYSAIRGINRSVRSVTTTSLGLVTKRDGASQHSSAEIRLTAALNGAFGDHLEASHNPLATSMSLMLDQRPLVINRETLTASIPQASAHLVILVHGLGLSELGWNRKGKASIADRLQAESSTTPLQLRYNSGRHISTNGQEFEQLVEQLCEAWPVPVESLSFIGYSMGGLVVRSACYYAQKSQSHWLKHLKRVVFLGTPHHGSPLERAGHSLDLVMQKIPYTKPLAYGKIRSAGVKDLRHGNLLDEDWQGHNPDQYRPDSRSAVPLLAGVEYFFGAATLGLHEHDPLGHLIGDLLVRTDSAMGSHKSDQRHFDIKPENCQVFHQKNHFDLLDDEQVHRQVIDWLQQHSAA